MDAKGAINPAIGTYPPVPFFRCRSTVEYYCGAVCASTGDEDEMP